MWCWIHQNGCTCGQPSRKRSVWIHETGSCLKSNKGTCLPKEVFPWSRFSHQTCCWQMLTCMFWPFVEIWWPVHISWCEKPHNVLTKFTKQSSLLILLCARSEQSAYLIQRNICPGRKAARHRNSCECALSGKRGSDGLMIITKTHQICGYKDNIWKRGCWGQGLTPRSYNDANHSD